MNASGRPMFLEVVAGYFFLGARVASVEPKTRQHNATTGSGASRTPMTEAASLLSCSSISSGAMAILLACGASSTA